MGNANFGERDSSDSHDRASETAYVEALNRLYDRINYEKIGHAPYTANHYRLDRMRALLTHLGNPHLLVPMIHVAGTKGKGTTSTLIYDALRACGYRTGLYTSPHLLRLEERIQFEGRMCEPSDVVELTACVLAAAEKVDAAGGGRATFFELTTAMGMLYFARRSADCVVLETGLGGRLDSTNVCQPIMTIITSISLDHQAQLGNTIPEIAREKAGILKTNVPAICTALDEAARQVISSVAEQVHAPLRMIDRDFFSTWGVLHQNQDDAKSSIARVSFHCDRNIDLSKQDSAKWPGKDCPYCNTYWETRMLGQHQNQNLAGAIAAFQWLSELGWNLPVEKLQSSIATTVVPARLELIDRKPTTIIDTAHNPASIQAAIEALDTHFPTKNRVIIFASSRDKDYRRMLELLIPNCDTLITTAYQENPRALPVHELHAEAKRIWNELECNSEEKSRGVVDSKKANILSAPTPAKALECADPCDTNDSILVITGSFFLAAELIPLITKNLRCSL